MSRKITITRKMLEAVAHANETMPGRSVVLPVDTGWPEFRLTEEQMMANAIARVNGQRDPYPYQYVTLEF